MTILELLAAIAVVAVLAALLLPAVNSMAQAGRRAACQANLRQISIAFNLYRAENRGAFPPSADQSTISYFPWYETLLGHTISSKYDNIDRSFIDGSGGPNYLGSRKVIACPAGSFGTLGTSPPYPIGYGMTSLALWNPPGSRTDDVVTTFFSRSLLKPSQWPLVMCADYPRIWLLDDPKAEALKTERFAARHNGVANVIMVDGHLEQVRYGDKRWAQGTLNRENYYSN